jgi:hypothetical protein
VLGIPDTIGITSFETLVLNLFYFYFFHGIHRVSRFKQNKNKNVEIQE